MVTMRLHCGLRLEVVTYVAVGVAVAIDVKDRQNVEIHVVEQAGHLNVTAIGGQSLGEIGKKNLCCNLRKRLCINACHALPCVFLTSLTNHWQKAGEIHSLAWMPQSMKIAGLLELVLAPICGCQK